MRTARLSRAPAVFLAGYNGVRSYDEQMEAIIDYILANHMTLEDV